MLPLQGLDTPELGTETTPPVEEATLAHHIYSKAGAPDAHLPESASAWPTNLPSEVPSEVSSEVASEMPQETEPSAASVRCH